MPLGKPTLLLLVLLQLLMVAGLGHAEEFIIPELSTRVSDQFLLESIGKLDDFIEDIRKKEEIRGDETVGFASSSIVQLGTLSGLLIDQFFFKTRILTPVFSKLNEVNELGKTGSFPIKLAEFAKGWMLTANAAHSVQPKHEKTFIVHVKDLPYFRQVLTQIREQQSMILFRFWKLKPEMKAKLENFGKVILENRPSFRKIYEACATNETDFKIRVYSHIYLSSLVDYVKLFTFSPSFLSAQYNAGFISPTLKNYIGQETFNAATSKCLNSDPNATGLWNDRSSQFVVQLLAIDGLSKFVIVWMGWRLWKYKTKPKSPGPSQVDKLLASTYLEWLKPVTDFFAKISPAMVAKALIATHIAASVYTLYTIRQEYKEAKEDIGQRRTVIEFQELAGKFFHVRAIAQIEILKKTLNQKDLDPSDIESLETEISNWEVIAAEFKAASKS